VGCMKLNCVRHEFNHIARIQSIVVDAKIVIIIYRNVCVIVAHHALFDFERIIATRCDNAHTFVVIVDCDDAILFVRHDHHAFVCVSMHTQ
jgi:hypothetical protein